MFGWIGRTWTNGRKEVVAASLNVGVWKPQPRSDLCVLLLPLTHKHRHAFFLLLLLLLMLVCVAAVRA